MKRTATAGKEKRTTFSTYSNNVFRTFTPMSGSLVVLGLFLVIVISNFCAATLQEHKNVFGTQCSFAITGPTLDGCGLFTGLDHRQAFYDEYMEGCYEHYGKRSCANEEETRHEMNARQPQSMVNMTSTGYRKLKAPDSLLKLLVDFWEANKEDKELEDWNKGSIYTVKSLEGTDIYGQCRRRFAHWWGEHLKDAIWDAAIDGIAEWTGGVAKLRPVSLYGIREYTEGAVLSPHVDRIPLVSSGIVNVAQDVDEPWPLEVYDRNGHAVNITMEPGDMILYESHSLIHGRPFPLKGRYYANVFIHFEPFDGWDSARQETHLGDANGDLPPYILPGSPEEENFRDEYPNGWSKYFAEGEEPPVNEYASMGNLEKLKEVGAVDKRLLQWKDENGWTPLHEAARSGHVDVVGYLVKSGADINCRTFNEWTPLGIAIDSLGESHPVSKYLSTLGAEDSSEEIDHVDDEYDGEEDGEDEVPIPDDDEEL